MNDDSPLTSRKLWISVAATLVSCVLPMVYKQMGISETVTVSVLGLVSAIAMGYNGFNVLDKKISKDS